MTLLELFAIAVGLSMDAFAVAVCSGVTMSKLNWKKAIIIGVYFGGFQLLMPLIGYGAGKLFSNASLIVSYDHWVTFILLAFIGGKMIYESFEKEEKDCSCEVSVRFKDIFPLALATSIDALAVGVSFALHEVSIAPAATFIGVITFTLSVLGVKIGNVFGLKYKRPAEIAGGVILILMGLKILLEHMGIIAF